MAWVELYPAQLKALHEMKNGCILCGGVGSGKSITSLVYYYTQQGCIYTPEQRYNMKNPKDLHIITTAKKRDSLEWDKELTPFLLSRDPLVNHYSNKVIIDSWNNIKKYEDVKNGFFIFDEQRVVGSGAWVKSFLRICRWNRWILLSATPGDTWSDYIPVFIANGFYRNRSEFTREHVIFSAYTTFPKIDRYINVRRLVRLRDSILVPIPIDRDRIISDEIIPVEYDKQKYKNVLRTRWDPYKDEPIQNAGGLCYILRRVVNEDESRQLRLLELLENHPKAIIFYNFDPELEILRRLGYEDETIVAEWNGHKHQEIPNSNRWVYLVQYSAGCEGWNCVSTDTIIFYSGNYSYRTTEQARGRIDRLNSPFKKLYYFTFRSKAPIDIAIANALANKKDFNTGKFAGRYFNETSV